MPSNGAPIYYWDSCVFLAAIEGEAERVPTIEQMLAECDEGKHSILTSHLSVTEVCFAKSEKSGKCLSESTEEKINKLWDAESPVKTVEVHEIVALNARQLIREVIPKGFGLKPADAIHLATARMLNVAEFHTYDQKLFKFAPMMGFGIVFPHVEQLSMFAYRTPLHTLRYTQWHWGEPRARRPDKSKRYVSVREGRSRRSRGRK